MLTKISPYISSLVSEHVSKLVGKNKSILVDTETGMLYYKDKKNQTKLLPNQDANLIKIYKLIDYYCNPYTDFEYNIPGEQCEIRKPMRKTMSKKEKAKNKSKKRKGWFNLF